MNDLSYCGKDTRWGVATADNIEGPYTHSEFNPVTNSGHETLLWNYDGGIAALLNRDGPEKDTIQYAKDGINLDLRHPYRIAHAYPKYNNIFFD